MSIPILSYRLQARFARAVLVVSLAMAAATLIYVFFDMVVSDRELFVPAVPPPQADDA